MVDELMSCFLLGAAAERARFFPTLVFIFLWTTFVYDFLACWTWNKSGWSMVLGGDDASFS